MKDCAMQLRKGRSWQRPRGTKPPMWEQLGVIKWQNSQDWNGEGSDERHSVEL